MFTEIILQNLAHVLYFGLGILVLCCLGVIIYALFHGAVGLGQHIKNRWLARELQAQYLLRERLARTGLEHYLAKTGPVSCPVIPTTTQEREYLLDLSQWFYALSKLNWTEEHPELFVGTTLSVSEMHDLGRLFHRLAHTYMVATTVEAPWIKKPVVHNG